MAKYFCISSPAGCYDDLVQYYVMKQIFEDVALAMPSDAYFSQMANDFTKTVSNDPYGYNRYVSNWARIYTAANINSWTTSQINTQLAADLPLVGVGDGSASHQVTFRALENSEQADITSKLKGFAFQVQDTHAPSIHQAPYSNATASTALFDKLYASTDVKFIYIDFDDKFSSHFDTWWNKLNLTKSGDSTWQTNKAAYKSDVRNHMGTQSWEQDSGPETALKSYKTWTAGYPTHNSGALDSRVHVLPIDKLLDKDATTMSELATFLGVNVSTNASNLIDEYRSATTV